jgi:hypothetical protein
MRRDVREEKYQPLEIALKHTLEELSVGVTFTVKIVVKTL